MKTKYRQFFCRTPVRQLPYASIFSHTVLLEAIPMQFFRCVGGHLILFNIQLGRDVDFVGNVFAVLFPLSDALRQQILYLSVHRAEVILCPCGDGVIQLGAQPQGYLLFRLSHISTDCRNLLPAGRRGCRRELPADWKPWRPCVPRPALSCHPRSGAQEPSQPCQLRRQLSSCGRR